MSKNLEDLTGLDYTNELRESFYRDLKRSQVISKDFASQIWNYLEVTQRLAYEAGKEEGYKEAKAERRKRSRK